MKKLIYPVFSIFLLFASCGGETKPTKEVKKEIIPAPEWVTYNTIAEVMESQYDYYESSGCLKLISDNEVQVSQWVFDGDVESTITEGVKRDIVYVAFQIFALSDINEVTVTSIPLLMKSDGRSQDKYLENYKKTVKVTREKATEILNTFANTKDFKELYEVNSKLWVPSKKFSALKYAELNAVFASFL